MLQIHILDRCEFCDGQAYVYACEFTDENGESYPRYMPCGYCKGSGELDKWVTLDQINALTSTHPPTAASTSLVVKSGMTWLKFAMTVVQS